MRQRTNGRSRWTRSIYASLVGVGLAALVFLGSPGCGCGDNLPTFPPVQERDCCCEFEWIMDQTAFPIVDVSIVLLGVDPSLEAYANPPQLLGVTTGVPQLFDICVKENHDIGAMLTLELRNQADNSVLGSAVLVYDQRCEPTIDAARGTVLTSTDCADECCCDFRWLTPDTAGPTVDINIISTSPGLTARPVPAQLTGVVQEEWTGFQVCVNDDHPISAVLIIELQTGANPPFGQLQLIYNTRCGPDINYTPQLPNQIVYSPDCGQTPPCCDGFEYQYVTPPPGGPAAVDIRIEARNVHPSLAPVVFTPSPPEFDNVQSQGAPVPFTVCVNLEHADGATMDLVVVDRNTSTDISTLPLTFDLFCTPTPGLPTGDGNWSQP